jgi:hypothetical protein
MKRRGITTVLVQLLTRTNEELLILLISFLKKLSLYAENKACFLTKKDIECNKKVAVLNAEFMLFFLHSSSVYSRDQ